MENFRESYCLNIVVNISSFSLLNTNVNNKYPEILSQASLKQENK